MIKLSNIQKVYNPGKSNEFEALKGVSCEIQDGELVAIIGKSGAGKSTMLHILACIDSYNNQNCRTIKYYIKALAIKTHLI